MDKNQQKGTKSKRTTTVGALLRMMVVVGKNMTRRLLSFLNRSRMIILKRVIVFFGHDKEKTEHTLDAQADAAEDGRLLVKITKEHQPGKTVRDWVQVVGVLLIPVMIFIATMTINLQQADLAKQQHTADLQIAKNQQQETILQTYLDNMSDLLLTKSLSESKPEDPVRKVAREQTLTTLRRLEAGRDRFVLQFLQGARLIGIQDAIIDLSNADLSNDDLSGANLSGIDLSSDDLSNTNLSKASLNGTILNSANLSKANLNSASLSNTFLNSATLSNADLSGADLGGADLRYADLSNAKLKCIDSKCTNLSSAITNGANLSNASLIGAILIGAILTGANLSNADLSNASLSNADLSNADLSNVDLSNVDLSNDNLNGVLDLTQQQLDEVYSCTRATLSPGLTCHHNR